MLPFITHPSIVGRGPIMRSIAPSGEYIIVIELTRIARARLPGLSAAPASDVFHPSAGPACAFSCVETSVRDRAALLSAVATIPKSMIGHGDAPRLDRKSTRLNSRH